MKPSSPLFLYILLLLGSTLQFCPLVVNAQSLLLPKLASPKFLGFYDLLITNRCNNTTTNTADSQSRPSDLLTIIGGTRLDLVARSHGKTETLNTFSSMPHIVEVPAQLPIGGDRNNRAVIYTQEVEHPTLVTISAKTEESWQQDFTDQDHLLLLPKLSLDYAKLSPEQETYLQGERLTIQGEITYPYPFSRDLQIYFTNPTAHISSDNSVTMNADPWEAARLFGSSSASTGVSEHEKSFSLAFDIKWPEDEQASNFYELTFTTSIFIVEPEFCNVLKRRVIELSFTVKNPKLLVNPNKKLLI